MGTLDVLPLHVEELEDAGNLVVKTEIPDLDPDKDVEITITDRVLEIRVERREETTVDDDGISRTELRYGRYVRSIALPEGTSADDVSAKYAEGILEIRVPITKPPPEPRTRKVPVKHAHSPRRWGRKRASH